MAQVYRKDHHTSIPACEQVGLWSKAGVLCIWNALSLQEGMEQSSDTAYMFQSSYFSLDITQAHDKLHVNKLQNSKMYGWKKSDSLKYKQISLRLSVNFMSGQKRVSSV